MTRTAGEEARGFSPQAVSVDYPPIAGGGRRGAGSQHQDPPAADARSAGPLPVTESARLGRGTPQEPAATAVGSQVPLVRPEGGGDASSS